MFSSFENSKTILSSNFFFFHRANKSEAIPFEVFQIPIELRGISSEVDTFKRL